jgi:hypothetical protein
MFIHMCYVQQITDATLANLAQFCPRLSTLVSAARSRLNKLQHLVLAQSP